MAEKTILITGCSSGIGLASAKLLRANGWRVFASCRKEDDCKALRQEGFESPRIDYSDPESIRSGFDATMEATGGTLDALFNNGAYAIPGPVEDLPTDALRAIFDSNFFGWHDLTLNALPIMRAQGHGHIIQCSSVLGFVTSPWRGAYNATKFALEGLTDTMRIELRDTNIKVVLIEPGPIRTKFRENAIPHFEKWVDWENSPRADQYRDNLLDKLYKGSGSATFELEAEAVAQKVLKALTASNPRPRYFVTTPTYLMAILKRILPTRVLDQVLSKGG
ncbi:MAG: SDR family NAD(P)-dependent oxidoreductase [Paracoccaceae bacterium]